MVSGLDYCRAGGIQSRDESVRGTTHVLNNEERKKIERCVQTDDFSRVQRTLGFELPGNMRPTGRPQRRYRYSEDVAEK